MERLPCVSTLGLVSVFVLLDLIAKADGASYQDSSLLQVRSARQPAAPIEPKLSTARLNPGPRADLNPATCVEAVLVEPRSMFAIARATYSALENSEVDLVTLAHGAFNADYVKSLVEVNPVLAKAEQQRRLRYLDLQVGDLGADEVGSSDVSFANGNITAANGTILTEMHMSIRDGLDAAGVQSGRVAYRDEYSRLLKSRRFWDQIICDKTLIMQSDSMLCPGSAVRLSEFFDYGFVGGHAPHMDASTLVKHPNAPRIVMNGGFSFRSRPQMLQCLDLFFSGTDGFAEANAEEDFFYSQCPLLEQPNTSMVDRFAIDNGYVLASEIPFGVHKPWAPGPYLNETMALCSGASQLWSENLL